MSNLPVVVLINLCLQYAYPQCPVSCRNDIWIMFPGLVRRYCALWRFSRRIARNPFFRDFIKILIDEIDLPIIVDAGIGKPSQACEAMEMGAAAIMANTALATAGDLPLMASAFRQAIEAGRKAYISGLGRVLSRGAAASDPLTGFLRD